MRAALAALAGLALAACAGPSWRPAGCAPEPRSLITGQVAAGYSSERGMMTDTDLALTAGVTLGGDASCR